MSIEIPINDITDEKLRALCAYVQEELERTRIPGAAVGIYQNGEVLTNGFGVTHKDHPLPVTSDTLFQIGSTTKTYTATLVMMLVEQGRLALDEPIRTYLPDLRLADETVAAQVTMRHLLTHVSGWDGDFFDDFGDGDDAIARYVAQLHTRPQYFPLGVVWAYNNAAFVLAGRTIEVITGKVYETAVKEMIFDPLGMEMSFFFENSIMLHRFAVGHLITDDGLSLPPQWNVIRSAAPAGKITSTVKDQMTYARFHLDGGLTLDGKRLLSEESIQLMQAKQVEVGAYVTYMGLSWMVNEYDDFRVIQHGGTTLGQKSAFFIIPERKFAFTILSNGFGRDADLRESVGEWVLREYFGVNPVVPEPLPEQPALAEYTGVYSMTHVDFIVTNKEGGLILEMKSKIDRLAPEELPPPLELQFYETDQAIVISDAPEKGDKFQFLRDAEGQIIAVRYGVRAYKRQ